MQEWSADISGLLIISLRVVDSIVCYLRSPSLPPSSSETLSPPSSPSPSLAAAGTGGAGGGRAAARVSVHCYLHSLSLPPSFSGLSSPLPLPPPLSPQQVQAAQAAVARRRGRAFMTRRTKSKCLCSPKGPRRNNANPGSCF